MLNAKHMIINLLCHAVLELTNILSLFSVADYNEFFPALSDLTETEGTITLPDASLSEGCSYQVYNTVSGWRDVSAVRLHE